MTIYESSQSDRFDEEKKLLVIQIECGFSFSALHTHKFGSCGLEKLVAECWWRCQDKTNGFYVCSVLALILNNVLLLTPNSLASAPSLVPEHVLSTWERVSSGGCWKKSSATSTWQTLNNVCAFHKRRKSEKRQLLWFFISFAIKRRTPAKAGKRSDERFIANDLSEYIRASR